MNMTTTNYHHTASDYLRWDTMLNLVRKLYRDGNYIMSLYIGCGAFFGLRVSDTKRLTWRMLLNDSTFTIVEQKTQKKRTIKINADFQKHIRKCYNALGGKNIDDMCFVSQKHTIFSTQRLNVLLKEIKDRYKLKDIEHFSNHSLRKCFGRKVVEMAGENSEMALIKLSELFQHSSVNVTRRYLGLRQEELLNTYDCLDF
jgi:integrase